MRLSETFKEDDYKNGSGKKVGGSCAETDVSITVKIKYEFVHLE